MNGCTICGGWAGRHDPIAHDAEPQETEVCGACSGAGGDAWDGPCTDCMGEGRLPSAGRHDPIAHDAEPDTPPAVCCMHKRFVPCRDDAEDCDISDHPADVEAVRRHQHDAEPQEDTVTEPTDELREALVDITRRMNPVFQEPLATNVAVEWVDDHILPVVTAWAERVARERAAEELRAAAAELHVARFNADEASELRWPSGAPRATPDTFYRGITVAELALKHRADALAADDRTGQR